MEVVPAVVIDTVRCMWYVVIHDLVPMNVRTHTINLMPADIYGEKVTLIHHPAECGANLGIWTTQTILRLAMFHRTTTRRISRWWLHCPAFIILPCPKHQATQLFLAHMVFYAVKNFITPSALDYVVFMICMQWRIYQCSTRL